MTEIILTYFLLGAFAGLVAGLLGVGGGAVIVPALVYLFNLQSINDTHIMHLALGTSLATIVVTAASAVIAHQRRGSVVWPVVLRLSPGMMLGALLGAFIADVVEGVVLQRFFGIFEIVVAAYMLLGSTAMRQAHKPVTFLELIASGVVIGGFSSVLGIGGGTMTVPYLTWRGRVIREAVAISSACGLPIAVAGCAGYIVAGWKEYGLPEYSLGYVYWPAVAGITIASLLFAPLGASLVYRLPVRRLRQVFAALLFVVGTTMILESN